MTPGEVNVGLCVVFVKTLETLAWSMGDIPLTILDNIKTSGFNPHHDNCLVHTPHPPASASSTRHITYRNVRYVPTAKATLPRQPTSPLCKLDAAL